MLFRFEMEYGAYGWDKFIEADNAVEAWKKFFEEVHVYDGGEDGGGGILESVQIVRC